MIWDEGKFQEIQEEITIELYKATKKFGTFNNPHEGYAVILEELDELWDEIKDKDSRIQHMKKEAIQVAAMAIRFIHDLC